MDFKFEEKKIAKEEFLNINEEDVMFITNPGRMGDEDGSNFVIKKGNEYLSYRIDGWMYGDSQSRDYISYEETRNHFPKWNETLKNRNNDGKYVYIHMGFGNGLAIDKRIYDKYEPYLLKEVNKEKGEGKEEPSMYYSSWIPALEKMINDKKNDD